MGPFFIGFYALQAQFILVFYLFLKYFQKQNKLNAEKYNSRSFIRLNKFQEYSAEVFDRLDIHDEEIINIQKEQKDLLQSSFQWINRKKKLPSHSQMVRILKDSSSKEIKGMFSITDQSWTLLENGKWSDKLKNHEISHWRPLV